MVKIKCAAIKYHLKSDPTTVKYMTGINHASCIGLFSAMDIPARERDMDSEVQGFLTDSGRFVDRKEAKDIAMNAGQIKVSYPHDIVYSEFINWGI